MDLSLLPVPVTVIRHCWDWLNIWFTVSATVLALVAIVLSVHSSRRNARERRNALELDVLIRVMEVCGHNLPGSLQVLQGLLMMLPEGDLPGIRNEVRHGRVPSNGALAPFMAEYFEAVNRRLNGR